MEKNLKKVFGMHVGIPGNDKTALPPEGNSAERKWKKSSGRVGRC
jgi:hypothetical protein